MKYKTGAEIVFEELTDDHLLPLLDLVLKLWPECDRTEESSHFADVAKSDSATCFLAKIDAAWIGFIYVALRHEHVEGASTSPVAYIEGIYVEPSGRQTGIGRQLVLLAEAWGRLRGCSQLASDTEVGNSGSIHFHRQAGFKETGRIVTFLKEL